MIMAGVDHANDLDRRTSKDAKDEVEVAQMDEKAAGYRLAEAEIPLEQRKEEARVLYVQLYFRFAWRPPKLMAEPTKVSCADNITQS